MNLPAYRLEQEIWQGESDDIVCRIVEFPGWYETNIRLAAPWPPLRPSERVRFDTNVELLELVPDYPNNNANWPLMSRRMLEVLLSVREFAYHDIPVTLVDDTIDVDVRLDVFGHPRPQYSRTDYVAVQLANHCDFLDLERSTYETSDFFGPGFISIIHDLVLDIPPEGLPPLFRLSKDSMSIYVSAEARAALTQAGICGPLYVPPNQW